MIEKILSIRQTLLVTEALEFFCDVQKTFIYSSSCYKLSNVVVGSLSCQMKKKTLFDFTYHLPLLQVDN